MTAMPKKGRLNFWLLLPLIALPAAVIAATPSLKASLGGPATGVIGAAAATIVMGYALYLSIRVQRCQDEVQAAGAAFGQKWGTTAGSMLFVALMMFPAFWEFAFAILDDMATNGGGAPLNRGMFKLAVLFGFGGTVILQTLGLIVGNMLWWRGRR